MHALTALPATRDIEMNKSESRGMTMRLVLEEEVGRLARRIAKGDADSLGIIPWAAPVISFGNILKSEVATLGLNPSNLEFMNESSAELEGPARRFHTLKSLDIRSWKNLKADKCRAIVESCEQYFFNNPYNRWFGPIDRIVRGVNASYYSSSESACHLDLVPLATIKKWIELTSAQREALLNIGRMSLSRIIRASAIKLLVLNGRSVVTGFESLADAKLEITEMRAWSLRRKKSVVPGYAFSGSIEKIGSEELGRRVSVVGFNHNIQSSFGVSGTVVASIQRWVAEQGEGVVT